MRNGDRENGGAWRGGRVEGEGIRDKRWNRLERGRERRDWERERKDWERERRDWRRRKEWKIERRTGASLLKAAQKKAKSRFFITNNVKNVTF